MENQVKTQIVEQLEQLNEAQQQQVLAFIASLQNSVSLKQLVLNPTSMDEQTRKEQLGRIQW